jgi:hypothetical protein
MVDPEQYLLKRWLPNLIKQNDVKSMFNEYNISFSIQMLIEGQMIKSVILQTQKNVAKTFCYTGHHTSVVDEIIY